MTADFGPIDGGPADQLPAPVVLAHSRPFRIGSVEVRPATREIIGPAGAEIVEPRVMQVLVALAGANGEILSRDDLIHACWEGRIVSENAIDRVISKLRRLAETVAGGSFHIDTITKVGYRLVTDAGAPLVEGKDAGKEGPRTAAEADAATIEHAIEPTAPWRLSRRGALAGGAVLLGSLGGAGYLLLGDGEKRPALPPAVQRDFDRAGVLMRSVRAEGVAESVALLRRVTQAAPGHADSWAYLALALQFYRHWVPAQTADSLAAEARAAGDRALDLDPRNATALVARAAGMPIYGDWMSVETALREALAIDPAHQIGRVFLGFLLANVGRTREALAVSEPIDDEAAMDPRRQANIAALLWCLGRIEESDRVIDRAMERWPRNYVVWFNRFYLYMRSGRPQSALALAARTDQRPPGTPEGEFALKELEARAILTGAPADVDRALSAFDEASRRTAGHAENAIQFASQIGRPDEAFRIADGYYFGRGFRIGAVRFTAEHGSYQALHERTTGILFRPVCASMRAGPRFAQLAEETGLASYWRRSGTRPDVFA